MRRSETADTNAFTLLEVLLTLFVACMLAVVFSLQRPAGSGQLFAMQLMERLEIEQYTAMAERKKRTIHIERDRMQTEDGIIRFKSAAACEPMTIAFTPKGSISKGGRLRCAGSGGSFAIVMQIGTGRMRVEKSR